MMIFSTSMRPQALHSTSSGRSMFFSCDICGSKAEGRHFPGKVGREDWAVLPEDWNESEDRRTNSKKKFLVVCQSDDCQHRAQDYSNGI